MSMTLQKIFGGAIAGTFLGLAISAPATHIVPGGWEEYRAEAIEEMPQLENDPYFLRVKAANLRAADKWQLTGAITGTCAGIGAATACGLMLATKRRTPAPGF